MNNKKVICYALGISLLFSSAINEPRQVPNKPFELKITMEEENNKKSRK